jgi:hypothetical protein
LLFFITLLELKLNLKIFFILIISSILTGFYNSIRFFLNLSISHFITLYFIAVIIIILLIFNFIFSVNEVVQQIIVIFFNRIVLIIYFIIFIHEFVFVISYFNERDFLFISLIFFEDITDLLLFIYLYEDLISIFSLLTIDIFLK